MFLPKTIFLSQRSFGLTIVLGLIWLMTFNVWPASAVNDQVSDPDDPALIDDLAETEVAEAVQPNGVDLPEMFRQWQELDRELEDKEAEFQAAEEPELQNELRGQYMALVRQSEALVEKIKMSALDAITVGSADEPTWKLLVGIIMNEVEYDRHNEASRLGDRLIAAGIDHRLFERAAAASRLSVNSKQLLDELAIRARQQAQGDLPQVKIDTDKGVMVVELFEDEAPNTVANFVNLVEQKFYDGLTFHRVIEGFVAQGGDPQGDGSGGPGYTIACECALPDARNQFYGSLSMAHAGKDTGGSQFFICLDRTSQLDDRHTVFGRVIEGVDVLDKLSRNYTPSAKIPNADTDSIKSMVVVRKRDHEYVPEKVVDAEMPPVQPATLQKKEPTGDQSADDSESGK